MQQVVPRQPTPCHQVHHQSDITLTPIVKRLESKGWLTRTVSHEDERQKCISLTEAGRQLQQEVRECCLADSLRNQVDLADAELAQLKQLCDRVAAQLGR